MGKKLTALLLALVMTLSLVVSAAAVCYDRWSTEGTETMVNSVNGITTSTITSIFERNNTMSPNPDGTQHTESVTSRTDMDSAGKKQGWSYSKATADRDLLGNKTRKSVGYIVNDSEGLTYSVDLGEDTTETKNGVTIATITDRYVKYTKEGENPADVAAALQVTEWTMMSYGEEVSVTTDDPAKGYRCQESISKTRNAIGPFTVSITGDAVKDGAFFQTATYSDLMGSKLETWTTGNEEGTQVREVMTVWSKNKVKPDENYQRITTTERQISKDGLKETATSTTVSYVPDGQGGWKQVTNDKKDNTIHIESTKILNADGSLTVKSEQVTITAVGAQQKTVTTKTTAKSGGKVTTKENSKNYQWSNGEWKLALERDNFNTRDAEGRVASSTSITYDTDGSEKRYNNNYNEIKNGAVQQLDDGWEKATQTQLGINGNTMNDSKTESRTQGISVIKQHQAACKPEKVEGKAATEYSIGWKDYYQCPFCGDIFEDAKGTKPIEDLELWKMTDGKTTYNGSDWRTKLLKLGRIALSALALREFARCTLAVATLPYRSVTVMTTVARVLTAARLVQAWQHAIFH